MHRIKKARSSGGSGASSSSCNCAAPETSRSKACSPGFGERHRRRPAVGVVAFLPDQAPFRHTLDHLAERAAIDADMGCELRQRQGAALMQRQHRAELARRDSSCPVSRS